MKVICLLLACSLGLSAYAADKRYKGDLNNDGILDLTDLMILTDAVSRGATSVSMDINGSGIVDNADLQTLAGYIVNEELIEDTGFSVGIGGWEDDGEDFGGVVGAPPRRNVTSPHAFSLSDVSFDPATGSSSFRIEIDNFNGVYGYLLNMTVPEYFSPGQMTLSLPSDPELITSAAMKVDNPDGGKVSRVRAIVLNPNMTAFSDDTYSNPILSYPNEECSGEVFIGGSQFACCDESVAGEAVPCAYNKDFYYHGAAIDKTIVLQADAHVKIFAIDGTLLYEGPFTLHPANLGLCIVISEGKASKAIL